MQPKNIDDVDNYCAEEEIEEEEEEEAKEEDKNVHDEDKAPVSEMDILKTKLAKARKVLKNGMLSRQDAVNRAAARRFIFEKFSHIGVGQLRIRTCTLGLEISFVLSIYGCENFLTTMAEKYAQLWLRA